MGRLNGDGSYAELCAIAGAALASARPAVEGAASDRHGELASLLAIRNGFYAFESALHVFPSGEVDDPITAEYWNQRDLWKGEYRGLADGLWCFAEDVFGVQFAIHGDVVVSFDPETGAREVVAASIPEWVQQVLADYPRVTGHPFAHAWQLQHGALLPGQRLLPVTPFVLGGAYETANFFAGDAVEGMRARGNLAVQIRDLPDGTAIEYAVVGAISYANVSEVLLLNLPELRGRYEDLLKDWGDEAPGPHVVYGDVLNRHIDELLESSDDVALRRVFAFVETIANSGDERVRDIVGATVCWYLGGDSEKLSRVRPHMGHATRQISDGIETAAPTRQPGGVDAIEFPAWRGGSKLELRDILAAIPSNEWFWRVIEFDGVGRAPAGMTMEAFAHRATCDPEGYRTSWEGLIQLADEIDDSHWVLLVAALRDEDLDPVRLVGSGCRHEVDERRFGFDGCLLVIRLFDSGSWWVAAPTATDEGRGVVRALIDGGASA